MPDLPAPIAALFEANPEMRRSVDEFLPQTWALAPTDPEGEWLFIEDTIRAFLRAAYGSGYVDATKTPTSCPIR